MQILYNRTARRTAPTAALTPIMAYVTELSDEESVCFFGVGVGIGVGVGVTTLGVAVATTTGDAVAVVVTVTAVGDAAPADVNVTLGEPPAFKYAPEKNVGDALVNADA